MSPKIRSIALFSLLLFALLANFSFAECDARIEKVKVDISDLDPFDPCYCKIVEKPHPHCECEWWCGLFGGCKEPEVTFKVTVKNYGSTECSGLKVYAYNAKKDLRYDFDDCESNKVICYDDGILPWGCDDFSLSSGEEKTVKLTTEGWPVVDWLSGSPTVYSFFGIAVIRVLKDPCNDPFNDDPFSKKRAVEIPLYYETLTIEHPDNFNERKIDDPLNFTWHLVLDREECDIIESETDFPLYQVCCCPSSCAANEPDWCKCDKLHENLLNLIDLSAEFPEMEEEESAEKMSPQPLCYTLADDGGVEKSIWIMGNVWDYQEEPLRNEEGEVEEGKVRYYIWAKIQYSTYDIRDCREEEDKVMYELLHQNQYKSLVSTFFGLENDYKRLEKYYEEKTSGELEGVGKKAMIDASNIYCFLTHMKDTKWCHSINLAWYTLTDSFDEYVDKMEPPLKESYIENMRRWNYYQYVDERISPAS